MLRKYWVPALLVSAVLIPLGLLTADDPKINQRFPVDERDLSAPTVGQPIHECARAVHVEGFIPNALVRVFADGVEVGKGTAKMGVADIPLTRELRLGENVTATQTVGTVMSGFSDPVPVQAYPKLTTPVVTPDVYECGHVARIENLIASTHVEVNDLNVAGSPVIGTAENTGTWVGVLTSALVVKHQLQAVQVACPDNPAKRVPSPLSGIVKVKPAPAVMPKPEVEMGFVEGSEVLFAHNLLPGAEIEFSAGSTVISSGRFANSADNWFPLDKPVPPGHPAVTARQKLCQWSGRSDPVFPAQELPKPVLGSGICEGSRFVSIDSTFPGATVVLFRRPAGSATATPIGYGGGVPGTLKLPVAKGVTLQSGDVLSALQYIGANVSPSSDEVTVNCGGGFNVITQHNDNFRTGAYLAESTLTPDAVLRHGMEPAFPAVNLQGLITTQPLYVRELQFQNGGANTVFIGTLLNWVYAINANNGNIIWSTQLQDTDPTHKFTRGIDATPVIDLAANRIYVLFGTATTQFDPNVLDYSNPAADLNYWLVALDLRNHTEKARTRVSAWVYRDTGEKVNFVAKNQVAHPALLLDHGSVYIGFGSYAASEAHQDYLEKYHGWVMRYRATDLALQSAFCTTPNTDVRPNRNLPNAVLSGSGVWQGGGGLAADPDGNIFFLTGNGRAEPGLGTPPLTPSYGDSFLKLSVSGQTLVPAPFVPSPPIDPDPDLLEIEDADLGSGGAAVIPGSNFVLGGGKSGWMYLLDRTTMTLRQRLTASTNMHTGKRVEPGPDAWKDGPHLHGSPTLWRRSDQLFLYVWGEKDILRQFRFDAGLNQFIDPQVHKGTVLALENTMPGGMLSVSASGGRAGTGVVWADLPAQDKPWPMPSRLYAFSADDLTPLWDVDFGANPHWAPPTIADGKVFIGTGDGKLVAYRLGPDQNRTSWSPFQPTRNQNGCIACHTAAQLSDLQRRWPLTRQFANEAAVRELPAIALRRSSPPGEVRRVLSLEGNGVRTFRAQPAPNGGALQWTLQETTADLSPVNEPGKPDNSASDSPRVHLRPGWIWTDPDGNRTPTQVAKTTPAPFRRDAPWMLLRVLKPAAAGPLAGIQYIQSVDTHAGSPPARRPRRAGELIRVPFSARYQLYR